MGERCGEVYDSADEYSRDDRTRCYYQDWDAREMAERIVELEDEAATLNAEADRARNAWRSARRRAFLAGLRLELAEQSRERRTAWLVRAVEHAGTYRRARDRYRLAWLSARRRAADEANLGMEALELRDEEGEVWLLATDGTKLRKSP